MKVQFELVIGENKFTLIEEVESQTDFFKKLHFYSTLPKVGPNGETDLQLRYRVAQKQYEYFSIVSEKAGMEFRFGQPKEAKGDLFPKGWEPLYRSENSDEESSQSSGGIGIGAPSTPTPAPQAQTAHTGIGAPKPAAAPKAATPAPAPAQSAPTAATPQVAAQAANILSKFGI